MTKDELLKKHLGKIPSRFRDEFKSDIDQLLSNGDKVSDEDVIIQSKMLRAEMFKNKHPLEVFTDEQIENGLWLMAKWMRSKLTPTNSIDREALKEKFYQECTFENDDRQIQTDSTPEDVWNWIETHCLSDNNRSKEK